MDMRGDRRIEFGIDMSARLLPFHMNRYVETQFYEGQMRKVRISEGLMDLFVELLTKSSDEMYHAVLEWGEPDAEGFYEPTITIKLKSLPEPVPIP